MPMKLNVGLTRKIGEANYGSRGGSVNIEMEVDSGLIAEPSKLQDRIRQLFTLVRSSLTEELNGNSNNHIDDASSKTSNGKTSNPRPATQSQQKAIFAIAKDRQVNVQPIIRSKFGVGKIEHLSIKQASELIDQLKKEGGGA